MIPGFERSPGEGNSNPLQYSWLEIPWTEEPGELQSTEGRSQARLKRLSTHARHWRNISIHHNSSRFFLLTGKIFPRICIGFPWQLCQFWVSFTWHRMGRQKSKPPNLDGLKPQNCTAPQFWKPLSPKQRASAGLVPAMSDLGEEPPLPVLASHPYWPSLGFIILTSLSLSSCDLPCVSFLTRIPVI